MSASYTDNRSHPTTLGDPHAPPTKCVISRAVIFSEESRSAARARAGAWSYCGVVVGSGAMSKGGQTVRTGRTGELSYLTPSLASGRLVV